MEVRTHGIRKSVTVWNVEFYVEIKMSFFFQVKLMDVEKCGTQDTNSRKQNGKNISRDQEVE